jgi:hypothetical protein
VDLYGFAALTNPAPHEIDCRVALPPFRLSDGLLRAAQS